MPVLATPVFTASGSCRSAFRRTSIPERLRSGLAQRRPLLCGKCPRRPEGRPTQTNSLRKRQGSPKEWPTKPAPYANACRYRRPMHGHPCMSSFSPTSASPFSKRTRRPESRPAWMVSVLATPVFTACEVVGPPSGGQPLPTQRPQRRKGREESASNLFQHGAHGDTEVTEKSIPAGFSLCSLCLCVLCVECGGVFVGPPSGGQASQSAGYSESLWLTA